MCVLHSWDAVLSLFAELMFAYMSVKTMTLRTPGLNSATDAGSAKEKIMNISKAFSNWRKYRQTINELGRLSSHELNDLGITRSDIHRVARGGTR